MFPELEDDPPPDEEPLEEDEPLDDPPLYEGVLTVRFGFSLTVIVTSCSVLLPEVSVAVIVALPFFKTVTSPFCVTVAVLLSLLFQVIVLSAAVEGSTEAIIVNFSLFEKDFYRKSIIFRV